MKLREVIATINEIKKNGFKNSLLVDKVSDLEARVKTDVFLLSYTEPLGSRKNKLLNALNAAKEGDYTLLEDMGIKPDRYTKMNPLNFFSAFDNFLASFNFPYYEGKIMLLTPYADCSGYMLYCDETSQYRRYKWNDDYPPDENPPEGEEDDRDAELGIKYPHDKIYVEYLSAVIDYLEGEYTKYINDNSVFEDSFALLQENMGRYYSPADGKCVQRGYYIKGDRGIRGADGTSIAYFYSFDIDGDGHLVYSAAGGSGNDFRISEGGNLIAEVSD